MRKTIVIAGLVLLVLPLVVHAQEEASIKETILGFRKCLQTDDYKKAVGYLSQDFIKAIKSSGSEERKEEGEDYAFLHQDPVEFVKKEMDSAAFENFEIVSINQDGLTATAQLKPTDGKLVKIFLTKESDAGWKITLAPRNVFTVTQEKNDKRIKKLDKKRQAVEWRQHLADDIGRSNRFWRW